MNSNIIRFWIVACLLVCRTSVFAQYTDWLNFTTGSQVTDMALAGDTLFITTTGGLVAYDKPSGTARIYTKTNSPISSHTLNCIAVYPTQSGSKLLIGTEDAGLMIRRANGNWAKFSTANSQMTSDQIHDVVWDGTDGFYVGTGTDLIYMDSFDDVNIVSNTGVTNITAVARDSSGNIWLGALNGSLVMQDIDSWLFDTQLSSGITAITIDTSGIPWAGTVAHGIAQKSVVGGWTIYNSVNSDLGTDAIGDLHAGADGTLWVGTRNWGLYKVYNVDIWDHFQKDTTQIPSNNLLCVLPESDGSVWVGTADFGMAKLSGTTWDTNFNISNSQLASMNLFYITPDTADGRIWIYSRDPDFNDIFQSFDGSTWTTTQGITGVQFPTVSGIEFDNRLNVAMQGNGIYTFDGNEWFQDTNVPNTGINDIYKDSFGRLYIATQSGIAYKRGTSWVLLNSQLNGLPNDFTMSICAYDTNDIWVASEIQTDYSQIYHFNGASWTTYDSTDSPLRSMAFIHDMASDDAGDVWIATSNGLLRFQDGAWLPRFTSANSVLTTNNIMTVNTHSSGATWIGTDDGLIVGDDSDTLRYGTTDSGLPSNVIRSLCVDSDGYPWIGTNQGLVRYDGGLASGSLSFDPPDTLNFGTVSLPDSQVIQITNTGSGNTTIQDVMIIGTDTAAFNIQNKSSVIGTLPASETATLRIGVDVSSSGQKTAAVIITSSASSSPDTIALTANVVVSGLQISQTGIVFGTVLVGQSSTWQGTMTNTGNSTLTFGELLFDEQPSGGYTLINFPGTGDTLGVGSTRNIAIQFTPDSVANYQGEVTINSNAASSPHRMFLNGTGARVPTATLSATEIDFGRVKQDTESSRTLTLSNTGNDTLTIYGVYFSNPDTSLILTVEGSTTVVEGAQISITVTFIPNNLQAVNSYIVIESNATTSPDSIPVSGRGVVYTYTPPTLPDKLLSTQNLQLSLTLTGLSIDDIVYFYYRYAGAVTWQRQQFVKNLTTYSIEILNSIFSTTGISYYIAAVDTGGTQLYLQGRPDQALWLEVYASETTSPIRFNGWTYYMITVPYVLSDSRILNALEDDFGTFREDNWRFYHWQGNDYVSLGSAGFTRFEPGCGYWIILNESLDMDLPEAKAVRADQAYDVPLAPGWNQVGNPFLFPVSVYDIENAGNIQGPARWIPQHDTMGVYTYADIALTPWTGYFVYNLSPDSVTISIPPVQAGSGTPKAQIFADNEFSIRLALQDAKARVRDPENIVGFLNRATDGIDRYDNYQAPAIEANMNLAILQDGRPCAVNYMAPNEDGGVWDLVLEEVPQNQTVTLRFHENQPPPENFNCYLLDTDRRGAIEIKNHQATIPAAGNTDTRHLKLIVGTEDFAQSSSDNISLDPYAFNLAQNYPNPFNPQTRIQYEVSFQGRVRLTLYNILGQRVRVLVDDIREAGRYEVVWDGKNAQQVRLSSGIYFYKFEMDNHVQIKKMILVR